MPPLLALIILHDLIIIFCMDTLSPKENTAFQQSSIFAQRHFAVAGFDGPLDLLWHLIKKNEVSIYDIPVALITEQYLDALSHESKTSLGDLSEFYRWASILLRLKTQMMAPRPNPMDDTDISDPRDTLVEKLIEYQKYKRLATLMEEKATITFTAADDLLGYDESSLIHIAFYDRQNMRIDTTACVDKMCSFFSALMKRYSNATILDLYESITVNEKTTLLHEILLYKPKVLFTELITRRKNKMDIICAFLALLEAVKTHAILIEQETTFGQITISRRE